MAALTAHRAFLNDVLQRQTTRRALADPDHTFPAQPAVSEAGPSRLRPPVAVASKLNVVNYVAEEETVRNDYCEWYGSSGEWGSNFILGAEDDEICEEYPALRKLMDLKGELVNQVSHSPLYLSLHDLTLSPSSPQGPSALSSALGAANRFDSILITPPEPLDWTFISSLPLRAISADPGFVFLWVGAASADGLEKGRECFAKWGFRRAEDIVWVKTNRRSFDSSDETETKVVWDGRDEGGLFAGQKEHCLMGIRGTVRRSTDSRFVHCNVDTDVMIWEDLGDSTGRPRYPPYLYTLIENFCLGTRRLHLFGDPQSVRRGWVTAGADTIACTISNTSEGIAETDGSQLPATIQAFDPATYSSLVYKGEDGRATLPYHPDIDSLRPKSPQRKPRNLPGGGPQSAQQANFGGSITAGNRGGPGGGGMGGMSGRSSRQGFGQGYNQGQNGTPHNISLVTGSGHGGYTMEMGAGDGMRFAAGQQGFANHVQMQPNQYPGQAQFDPMLLAQAQAQAHAAIQAQMHMAMMQQMHLGMQMQMGMGMGMGGAGQFGQYGSGLGMIIPNQGMGMGSATQGQPPGGYHQQVSQHQQFSPAQGGGTGWQGQNGEDGNGYNE